MFDFLWQSSLCFGVLYGLYHFMLADLTFFRWNRFYLLFSIAVSMAIPLFPPLFTMPDVALPWMYQAEELIITPYSTSMKTSSSPIGTWNVLFLLIYAGGVAFFTVRILYGLYILSDYYRKGKVWKEGMFTIIETNRNHLPFSFFNYIFLSTYNCQDDDIKTIIRHEKVHVLQYHSLDVIFIELVRAMYWFNPILPLYKRAIQQVHECLADADVCERVSTQRYMELLLGDQILSTQVSLGNHFFQSQIKQRIHMMTKSKNHKISRIKYVVLIPAITGLMILFSSAPGKSNQYNAIMNPEMSEDTLPGRQKTKQTAPSVQDKRKAEDAIAPPPPPSPAAPPPPPPTHPSKMEGALSEAEEMPRFFDKSCEAMTSGKEKDDCARMKLMQYVAAHLKYPEAAKKDSIEGMVVVSFIVTKKGEIASIDILKDPGYGFGNAVLDLLLTMNGKKGVWIPGRNGGKNVNVTYTLPVRFKLQ